MKKDYLLLIIFGVLLFGGGLYLGKSLKASKPSNFISDYEIIYKPIGSCQPERCLYQGPIDGPSGGIEGYQKIRGYYYQYLQSFEAGEESGPAKSQICDAFIVTEDGGKLTDNFIISARRGNKINSVTIDGKLILTLELPAGYQDLVESSSPDRQIDLGIISRTTVGREANLCESLVDIVAINPI